MIRHLSPAEMLAAGWTRVDLRPWSKVNARWVHRGGWTLEHCGHPTALRPWILTAPDGGEVRTGVRLGQPRDFGTTWTRLAPAVEWVGAHEEEPAFGGRPQVRREIRDPGPMFAAGGRPA